MRSTCNNLGAELSPAGTIQLHDVTPQPYLIVAKSLHPVGTSLSPVT